MAEAEYIFTSAEAAAWTGGQLLGDAAVSVLSAEVDSRKCSEGCLFFALEGERVDGHEYVKAAFDAGACGAVVSAGWTGLDEAEVRLVCEGRFLIAVDSPLDALQQTASAYMKNITGPVRVGITGSSGKTTTKELVSAVLGEKYSVVKTAGNYNSEIGLPLTVFNIRKSHDYAVIEMGINRVGEMDVLSEILRPDIVVITNIGTAHIGIFKNIETTAFEKRRSVSFFNEEGRLFVDEDEPFRDFLADGHPGKTFVYGVHSLSSEVEGFRCRDLGLRGWEICFNDIEIDFPLVGGHNLKNAVCACVIGRYAGLTDDMIKAGLEKSRPLSGRSEIIEGPVTVIQDCYNANADSLESSIEFADGLEWQGAKVYVIGDMKELGDDSRSLHERAGHAVAVCAADKVFFYGDDSEAAFSAAQKQTASSGTGPELYYTAEYEDLEEKVLAALTAGDLLLVKGSRSMNMERLLQPLAHKFGEVEC